MLTRYRHDIVNIAMSTISKKHRELDIPQIGYLVSRKSQSRSQNFSLVFCSILWGTVTTWKTTRQYVGWYNYTCIIHTNSSNIHYSFWSPIAISHNLLHKCHFSFVTLYYISYIRNTFYCQRISISKHRSYVCGIISLTSAAQNTLYDTNFSFFFLGGGGWECSLLKEAYSIYNLFLQFLTRLLLSIPVQNVIEFLILTVHVLRLLFVVLRIYVAIAIFQP